MTKTQFLFLVILIEGYVILAVELLAIRGLIPFFGSGTEIISVIISAVLMPLAYGYYVGGNQKLGINFSIRKILLRNLFVASIILTLGLSYVYQETILQLFESSGIHNRLLQAALFCLFFLSVPVFLLGQTIPLVSNYFPKEKLSHITGKMLFFSTIGSFLGSVFSTIVLMKYVGVHNTVIITISLLCFLILMLVRRLISQQTIFCLLILSVLIILNSGYNMSILGIVSNNSYNLIRIINDANNETKIFNVNRSASSKISKNPEQRFPYIAYIEDNIIAPISHSDKPLDVLVIGAGGFTIGINDKINNYTFVDIDPDLKEVAEKHFLPEKLSSNKQFIASSARAFVHNHKRKYDIVVIDVFTNTIAIPMECTTKEFLAGVKSLLKDKSVVIANVIASPVFGDKFTVRYHNTFASVFPVFSRQIIGNTNLMEQQKSQLSNLLYMYFGNEHVKDNYVYSDNNNALPH
jgi:hypothetical protein